jgi:RNA exonuclease 1
MQKCSLTTSDMNTRFSGITQADLDSAVMDLPQAREAVCAFIGPNTVLVGHGLENDLRALRLLHRRVIDTAVVSDPDLTPLTCPDISAPQRQAIPPCSSRPVSLLAEASS